MCNNFEVDGKTLQIIYLIGFSEEKKNRFYT